MWKNVLIIVLVFLLLNETALLVWRGFHAAPPAGEVRSPDPVATVKVASDPLSKLQAEIEALRVQVSVLEAELERERENAKAVLKEKEALEAEFRQLDEELLFTYGTARESGIYLGALIRELVSLQDMDPESPDYQEKVQELMVPLFSLGPLGEELEVLQDKPEPFADFQAAFLTELIHLEPAQYSRIREVIYAGKMTVLDEEPDSAYFMETNARVLQQIREAMTPPQRELWENLMSGDSGGPTVLQPFIPKIGAPVVTPSPEDNP